MQFRLTYEGQLLAHRDGAVLPQRSLHVHRIRKKFCQQLKKLWAEHPVLNNKEFEKMPKLGSGMISTIQQNGFLWLPIVQHANGLRCALNVLMLRDGVPGQALSDVDNRLKTIFDALRMAKDEFELGKDTKEKQQPSDGETPFYVLLEDDSLITQVSVTTDMLLQPVVDVKRDEAVRLVIDVTVRPYHTHLDNLAFA
jgi:hypothetical protein